MERCRAGDTGAFEAIVERYQQVLFSVAFRMLGEREDARDATQTAFVKAFERLDSYDPKLKFFSWIYRVLVNECLNVIRARRPHEPLTLVRGAGGTQFEAMAAWERRRRVRTAVHALPSEQRDVIVLRHFAEMSYEEIAETLGIPANTVKSRLFAARQVLGRKLLDWKTT